MKLNEVRSAIRNAISDGLKGSIPNMSYSLEQMLKEAFLLRNSLVMDYSMKGKMDFDSMFQTFDSIPIKEIDLSNNNTEIRSGICRNYIKLPKPSPSFNFKSVKYIGDVSKSRAFKVYTNSNFTTHKFKQVINKRPYVFLDTSIRQDGTVIAYLYNMGESKQQRYMTVKMIAENPINFISDGDCCVDILETEFPAPGWMQKKIIDGIANKYIEQYRKLNIPDISLANKQRDINT